MFKNLHLWANIMLGLGLALLLAFGGLSYGGLLSLHALALDAQREQLRQSMETLTAEVAGQTRLVAVVSALVANLPEVQRHVAAGDRARLQAALSPAYQVLAKDYGAVQLQFHTPPATAFLRLQRPAAFGDDLSATRPAVVEANRTRQPQAGLEAGDSSVAVRGLAPLGEGDRHLGVVEFGLAFGRPFFDAFKARYGVDAGLILLRNGAFETVAGTTGDRPLLPPAVLQAALAGEPQFVEIEPAGRPLAVYAAVLRDDADNPLGVVELARDGARYHLAIADAIQQAKLIGGLVLLLSLGVAMLTARPLSRRIRLLAAAVARVAAGDLRRDVPGDGVSELADLARAANGMRRRLHALVTEVEAKASAVSRAAAAIAQAVDGQAANATQMSASVAQITSTMEQLSASSSQIAEYSESVVEVARRTFDNSRAGADAMQRLAARMGDIRDDNRSALDEILDLGRKSKEISRIMEIIDTVADQTRLIAFNAALEAASAGDAGRRFGVVAVEIRRLADSVSESTGEIAHKVAEIQESISRLVVTSEKGTAGIEQGMQESARTQQLLDTMVDGADETTRAAQQISLSSQQQRTASNQVVVALREIVAASADTAASVRRIADIAQDMTRLSADLEERMGFFKLAGPDTLPSGQSGGGPAPMVAP